MQKKWGLGMILGAKEVTSSFCWQRRTGFTHGHTAYQLFSFS